MHQTKAITKWSFVVILLLACGCAPPEPKAPPQPAAPEAAEANADAPAETATAEDGSQLTPPAIEPATGDSDAEGRTAFYRGEAGPAEIPSVALSKRHEALCRVKVGDSMPEIALPRAGEGGDRVSLPELAGEKATVVVFWTSDRRMAREQLADIGPDVIEQFGERGVAVVGIAVNESEQSAEEALQQARARFANLLDREGEAFAAVGSERLPRTYLVDSRGKILWFDIEYSLSTRRELRRALRAVTESQ
jgi:peroxiredoxin